ncbi:MAG: HDOD domain-containing protein [Myxococcales bacterium]|nr:HDOD domain-containing protein [Myxococcales bacterium]
MIDLDALIRESGELEPLPETAARLARIFSDEDWDIDQVVSGISLDPALTARLLRVANSAANSGAEPITTVERAAMRTGAGTILSLTVGTAVGACMKQPLPAYGAPAGSLWRHSVAAALAAELASLLCTETIPPRRSRLRFSTTSVGWFSVRIWSRSCSPSSQDRGAREASMNGARKSRSSECITVSWASSSHSVGRYTRSSP